MNEYLIKTWSSSQAPEATYSYLQLDAGVVLTSLSRTTAVLISEFQDVVPCPYARHPPSSPPPPPPPPLRRLHRKHAMSPPKKYYNFVAKQTGPIALVSQQLLRHNSKQPTLDHDLVDTYLLTRLQRTKQNIYKYTMKLDLGCV